MIQKDQRFLASWVLSSLLFLTVLYLLNPINSPIFHALFMINNPTIGGLMVLLFGGALYLALLVIGLPSLQYYIQWRFFGEAIPDWWQQSFYGLILAAIATYLLFQQVSVPLINLLSRNTSLNPLIRLLLLWFLLLGLAPLSFRFVLAYTQSFAFPKAQRSSWLKANLWGYSLIIFFIIVYQLLIYYLAGFTYVQLLPATVMFAGIAVFYAYAAYLEADCIVEYFIHAGIPMLEEEDSPRKPKDFNISAENLGT